MPRRPLRLAGCTAVLAASIVIGPVPLAGQASSTASVARGPLLERRDLVTAGVAVAAAGALVPFDARIARWSQRSPLQRNSVARGTAAAMYVLGSPGALAIGGATYGVGLLAGQRATAQVGLRGAGAVVAAGVVTGVIKAAAGRARPSVTHDSNPTSFVLARGLRRGNEYQSLPSGHATAAFALAGALAAEGAHRWPATNRVTGPAGYSVAALVASSRIYHDRHWASDVVLGSGIGAVAGAVLVRYARSHPDNGAERRLLPSATAPRPLVSWMVRF